MTRWAGRFGRDRGKFQLGMTIGRTPESSRWRQLKASLGLLATVLIAGTLGFYLLGDSRGVLESVYLTVVIVTTVGLKDQYPHFNEAESAWALVIMLVGVATALYATGNLVAFLIGGELRTLLGRRQLESKIKLLRDHFIVCGFGRMGRALCDALSKRKTSFVVIDNNPERTAMAEERGYPYILGDATLEQTLETARISGCPGPGNLPEERCRQRPGDTQCARAARRHRHHGPGREWRRRKTSCCGPAQIGSSALPCRAPPGSCR